MIGRRYNGHGQSTNTAAETLIELRSTTAIRPHIYDLVSGSDATPADNAAEYNLQRTTTAGTEGSGFTPVALDPGDPAAVGDFSVNHSAEPTYTANAVLLNYMHNQRATFRWVAAPDGEIVLPAAANGVGIITVTVAGSAVNTGNSIHYAE